VQTYQPMRIWCPILGDTLAQVRSVIANWSRIAKTLEHTDFYDLEPAIRRKARGSAVSRRRTQVHNFSTNRAQQPVLDILKKTARARPRCTARKLNMKSAQYGSPVEWHQDWRSIRTPMTTCSRSAVLADIGDLANGPMLVTPGTHNRSLEPSRR